MKRFCIIMAVLCTVAVVAAQTSDINIDTNYVFHEAGDKQIRLSLSWILPMPSITGDGDIISIADTKQTHGFGGFIGYNYYITPSFYVGGLVNFSGIRTIAGNTFFFIPITGTIGYQFTVNKFEFPIELGIGVAMESYNGKFYCGPVLQPSVGIFYRLKPEWSLGFNITWDFLPQWYDDSDLTRYGNELSFSFGFRYHF